MAAGLTDHVWTLREVLLWVPSQSSIFGQNPKIGCQEFNNLQAPKLSKKQLCDRIVHEGVAFTPLYANSLTAICVGTPRIADAQ